MMTGWGEFILAFTVFFLSHSFPVRPPVRPWLVARLGSRGFTLGYSVLSLAVLGWVIAAAGRAPYVELWGYAPWQNHLPLVAMGVVCLILAAAIWRPNPFSFGGAQNDQFDPKRAGLVRYMRHPLLVALALWAFAHLAPNGDLAHVILFGIFAGFALMGMPLITRRKKRQLGQTWYDWEAALKSATLAPRPLSWSGAVARLAVGIGLYAALLAAHPWLFGVNPLP